MLSALPVHLRAWTVSTEGRVFLVALALRGLLLAFVAADPSRALQPDSTTYLLLGQHLAAHGRYLSILRPPLYPAFLAPLSILFGPGTLAPLAAQVLMDSGTAVLVCRLALAWGLESRAAAAAGLLYAASPLASAYAVQVMSETLFTFLLAGTLLFWFRARRASSAGASAATGLCCAGLMLCRSIGLLLPVFLILASAAAGLRATAAERRRLLLQAGLLMAVSYGMVLPYMAYNAYRSGAFRITTVWEFNTAFYTGPALQELSRGASIGEFLTNYEGFMTRARRRHWQRLRAERGWKEKWDFEIQDDHDRVREVAGPAFRVALASPGGMLKLHLAGALRQVVPNHSVVLLDRVLGTRRRADGAILALVVLLHGGAFALAAVGTRRAVLDRRPAIPLSLFLGAVLYFIATPGAGAESDRFSVPAIPLLCLLATAAWAPRPNPRPA